MHGEEHTHQHWWYLGFLASLFAILWRLPSNAFSGMDTLIVGNGFWLCFYVLALIAWIHPFFLTRLSVAGRGLYRLANLISMILLYHYVYAKWGMDWPKVFLLNAF